LAVAGRRGASRDGNPQTHVSNIFFAKPGDYRKAVRRDFRTGAQATSIELPVVQTQ
jgi:hypothetical protein